MGGYLAVALETVLPMPSQMAQNSGQSDLSDGSRNDSPW